MLKPFQGFTFIELIVVTVIIATLSMISLPKLDRFYEQHQVKYNVKKIKQLLNFARNQAISYRARVSFCTLTANTCTRGDLQAGISIFIDKNGDLTFDNDDILLKETPPFNTDHVILLNRKSIRFLPDGLATGANGSINYCSTYPDLSLKLIINQAGRVRKTKADAKKCT